MSFAPKCLRLPWAALATIGLAIGNAGAAGPARRFEALPPSTADREFEVRRSDDLRAFGSRSEARAALCEGAAEGTCREHPLFDEGGERYFAIARRLGGPGATVEALDLLIEDRASGRVTASFHVEVATGMGTPWPAEAHESPSGRLIRIPLRFSGTGGFNGDIYFLREGGAWREVDASSWLATLRLPPGHNVWKGVVIDPRDFSARSSVWREGDGNCCPSGGEVRVRLRIEGRVFAIDRQEYSPVVAMPR